LKLFNYSIPKLLLYVYSDYNWKLWRFGKVQSGWWLAIATKFRANQPEAIAIVRQYFDDLSYKFSISEPSHWFRLSQTDIATFVTSPQFIRLLGGLRQTLEKIYPEQNWGNVRDFKKASKRSTQWKARIYMSRLFPDERMYFTGLDVVFIGLFLFNRDTRGGKSKPTRSGDDKRRSQGEV